MVGGARHERDRNPHRRGRAPDLASAGTHSDPVEVRRRIRAGAYDGQTGGLARGYVQANLAVLPAAYADEFARFCQRNPKPCPLLAVSEPGSPHLPELARDLDLRTDLPRYRVYRDGEAEGDVASIGDLWQTDFVAFALGCSFSFEEALVDAGLTLRHWNDGGSLPDVPDRHRVRAGRPVPQPDGGLDASVPAGGRHQGGADHEPLPARARRAGPSRDAGAHRDRGHRAGVGG